MSKTRTTHRRRHAFGRLVAIAGLATVAASAGGLLYAGTASATVDMTITAVSPHLVPAGTANQVITVTGTGFNASNITSVAVTTPGDVACPTIYIVLSATEIAINTTGTTCATGAGTVTVTDASGSVTNSSAAAQLLTFVAPPTIATPTATSYPMVNANTTLQTYAEQGADGLSASTKGGTVVKIVSGSTGFATSAALPISASFDGVPLTGITITGSGAGNSLTGVLGAKTTAPSASPVLTITNNGVSASFKYAASGDVAGTFDYLYSGSSITVSPASGPVNGGTVLSIAGTGFSTTAASDVVTVGGVSCPISGTPTATLVKCTAPLTATAGPVTVQIAVTGGLTSVVGAGSTYTYLAQ